jgi:hypothetical protein
MMVMVAAMSLLVLVATVGMLVDHRQLIGENVWLKPWKFGLAFAAYGATLAWMLSKATRASKTMWTLGTLFAVTGFVDVGFIAAQAARGTFSHFNVNTDTFNVVGQKVFMSGVLGLFGTSMVIAIVLLFQRIGDAAQTWALRIGIGVAAIGMFLGYFIVGVNASAGPRTVHDADGGNVTLVGGHGIGDPDGNGMPLTDWSITGGDMRVPHFFGLHAIQVLLAVVLALNLLATRLSWLRDAKVRARLLGSVAFGYVGFVTVTAWQAVRGQSLIHPDSLTLAAWGVAIGGAALLGAATVLSARRRTTALGAVERHAPRHAMVG